MLLPLSGISSLNGASIGIAARINGKIITTSEVREAVDAQRAMIMMTLHDPSEQAARLREVEDQALFALLERELVLTEFTRMGGSIRSQYVDDQVNDIVRENFAGDREKFISELAKQGMTPKKFRELREKMIVVQVMRSRQLKDLPPPTPAEVEAYYKTNAAKYRDKDFIKISTITIPKYPVGDVNASPESQKKLAEELRTKLNNGADFGALAKTYSQDSHSSVGGAWDWIERSQMGKLVADAAFDLKAGSVSRVVEVDANYMLILCNAMRPGNQVELDKVRPEIEKAVQSEKGRHTIGNWTRTMAGKAAISPEDVRQRFMDYLRKP